MSVQVAMPVFAGAIRATAVYAGAAAAKALYYGAQKLWPPALYNELRESLATVNPADGSLGHSRFHYTGGSLAANNLTRIGFKFAGGIRIKNATITTDAGSYALGVDSNWNLVRYFSTHDLDITTDGIGRTGWGDLGGGWVADTCGFWLDIPPSSLIGSQQIVVNYDFVGDSPDKHGVGFWETGMQDGQGPNENYIGTWGNNPRASLPDTTELALTAITLHTASDYGTLYRRNVVIQNNH